MRKIAVLTGKRGGYGAMKPMLRLLRDDPNIALRLYATDQHTRGKFGQTLREISEEFNVHSIPWGEAASENPVEKRALEMGVFLGLFSDTLKLTAPDVLVLYGDRSEVLMAAIAATMHNIPIAHLQGGDESGSHDNVFRKSISALASLHFVSTTAARRRLSGIVPEDSRFIYTVGDHHIDNIIARDYHSEEVVRTELRLQYGFPIGVVLFHPDTYEPAEAHHQAENLFNACKHFEQMQYIIVYPCSDPGHEAIFEIIEKVSASTPGFHRVFPNLTQPMFHGLMAIADVIIGNSSCGIIEAPYFDLPAVNVGRRQEGRLRSNNVVDVAPTFEAIRGGIYKALSMRGQKFDRPFGNGYAGEETVKVLKETKLGVALLRNRGR